MKAVVSLILLLTGIAADADNEVPSDDLISRWRKEYSVLNNLKPRCFRSCSPDEEDFFWKAILGKAAQSMTESGFIEYMTSAFATNRTEYIQFVHDNAMLGIPSFDIDNDHMISVEEFYTEHLCLGFDLDKIRKVFDRFNTTDNRVPISEVVHTFETKMIKQINDDVQSNSTK